MHMVIAMHQEDINEVQQYVSRLLSIHSVAFSRPRIFLYVKGGPEVAAEARQAGFAHEVIELPNIGREQETYVRHVVTHYDHLPAHVFFTQVGGKTASLFRETTLSLLKHCLAGNLMGQ